LIRFRDFTETDREVFLSLCREFYGGDAVDHPIPGEFMTLTFDEILKRGPYARGVLFEKGGELAGYGQLSFTWSNEAGGLVVLVEEILVLEKFRGKGIGTAYLRWLKEEYKDAKRFRLEVCPGNAGARRLYEKEGYEQLHYDQMICGD